MACRLAYAALLLTVALPSLAFEVPVVDTDYTRQICSGMWANQNTFVNVSFDEGSQGQLAMVIYEWGDYQYLGKVTSETEDYLPRTYVCTSDAVRGGFCAQADIGRFILDLPDSMSISDTSFWSARVAFLSTSPSPATESTQVLSEDSSADTSSESSGGFWDNPNGNPTPPEGNYTSPWRRRDSQLNPSPSGLFEYHEPIQYLVRKTGYYCVAIVPVTVLPASAAMPRQDQVDAHPHYSGIVLFQNKFNGKLPATDYPKVNFYTAMLFAYLIMGGLWAWSCWKYRTELLPIQYYLSGLVGFLVIEMLANLTYYRYLNAHGKGTAATVFLFVVAILDAGRNSLSFFLLLVVSLGLSVVREDLGKTMRRCQILAALHFIFGVLYAVGIVELEFESTSALVLLLFVIPLAFTLSGFLMWTLYSLNATIVQLRSRKQHFKLRMFQRLQWILVFVVVVITIFFFVSSLTFSGRLAEDYAAKSWQMRWWLLDGWLSLLYFTAFAAVAYLWRPSLHNSRLLMSEELAQDEEDAEDYDLEAIESRTQSRTRSRDDDEATLVGGTVHSTNTVANDAVVFEIGDEDAHDLSDEEDDHQKYQHRQRSSSHEGIHDDERAGLMGGGKKDD